MLAMRVDEEKLVVLDELGRRLGDGLLLELVGGGGCLGSHRCAGGEDGLTVAALDLAALLESRQVAADREGGGPEPLRKVGDVCATALLEDGEDVLPALLDE